ncbi:MAG: hypothetical protein V7751_16710, partial [Pseudoalteromonas distincta]
GLAMNVLSPISGSYSDLPKDFSDKKSTSNANQIIAEYCWRLAEIDLKNINSFLKNQKSTLLLPEKLNEIKHTVNHNSQDLFKEFNRELIKLITEKTSVIYGWFKRPLSVSPKASLSLLYKAVVAEVKDSFPLFEADTDFEEESDIELIGGPYHVLYDAFYLIVYNAAKHGSPKGILSRKFTVSISTSGERSKVIISISSSIKDEDDDDEVLKRLTINANDDIDNAQMHEHRSGIKKLHHLQKTDQNFQIEEISAMQKQLVICISYALEHS